MPLDRSDTVEGYFRKKKDKILLLRQDVDAFPLGSLRFAEEQHAAGVRTSYYFRIIPKCFDPRLIERIARLGHEIGYHYEDVAATFRSMKRKPGAMDDGELIDRAFDSFRRNLELLSRHFDVRTICRHGSPLCPYDEKRMWEKYDYRELGILGDAGLDIRAEDMRYLTDTGRRWDGDRFSRRDRIPGAEKLPCRTTFDIIRMIEAGRFPDRIMMTFHPQRWNDNPIRWTRELILQNLKNTVKYFMLLREPSQHPELTE